MITAKIKVVSKSASGEGDDRQVAVSFQPDYADGRNKEWSRYTPAMNLSITLKGAVADQFEVGDAFTLQFVKDEPEA